jgi:hypothetical protein
MKCKTDREMKNPDYQLINGRTYGVAGTCDTCGGKMFKMTGKPDSPTEQAKYRVVNKEKKPKTGGRKKTAKSAKSKRGGCDACGKK